MGVENHRAGASKFDLIAYNVRALCLLSYFSRAVGSDILYDSDEVDGSVGDHFTLGLDLQYMFRYCLVIHLNSLKDKGLLDISWMVDSSPFSVPWNSSSRVRYRAFESYFYLL